MPVAAPDMGGLALIGGHRAADFQALENSAVLKVRALAAALAQVQQLFLQGQQAVNARLDVMDMLVDQGVDAGALVLGAVAQVEQAADLLEGHVQAAAIADKGQALGVGLGVEAIVAFTAGRFRQQPFALVVTDGLDLTVGEFRQFANLHCRRLRMGA